ncbi:MAG: DUF2520 domain-containing protein [Bacteroidaceae bacterium]|nr:DUF2520 domain-containing protein [Bacteroidaceae bacterium]
MVGAGNMATALALSLKNAGNTLVAVWSRTTESAQMLADKLQCAYTCDIASLPSADIFIISVVDSVLHNVASQVVARYPNALILHTAGSIDMEMLHSAGATNYGVLYPMQTVNKHKVVSLRDVTTFIEGCNDETIKRVEVLARTISDKVVYATSKQRSYLHVAAVFTCNFSNVMYNVASEILKEQGLPFDAMLPLVDEAARKVHNMSPSEAQTGPARRGDSNVMNTHLSMLNGEHAAIYSQLSEYILRRNK